MDKTFDSMSKGNMGALNFLLALSHAKEVPIRTVAKVQSSGIEGGQLYVLWNDLCDCDLKKVVQLMDNCPLDELKDACSRVDRSGKALIAAYIS